MPLLPQADLNNPRLEECLRLHKCWWWFLVLGIAIMIVGVLAIGAAFITGLATMFVFGLLLLGGGVIQIVNAFLGRSWRGFFLHLLAGVLHLVLGILLIEHPLAAAAGLTLVLAAVFLVGGILRVIFALMEDFSGRPWVLLNGVVSFLLGLAIWRQWPEASAWVIGVFVGIDLLFAGWSWVMLGLIVKALVGHPPSRETAAPTTAPAAAPPSPG